MINISSTFHKKNILITGGTGSIGSEIVRQLIRYNPVQIRIFSRDESKHFFLQRELDEVKTKVNIKYLIGDIRDKERLARAFRDIDIVFHAAALKHVPYCEYNPFEAVKTNIYGTQNIIDLSIDNNVDKVMAISTDKAVYPNTIMGITKLLMERMIISSKHYIGPSKTKFSVVRFGNVLNSRGSVIPSWVDQIKRGMPVSVTDKRMKRYFISIPDAVRQVLLATTIMKGQEIFILRMKEESIYEMALKTIKKHGNGQKVPIKIIGIRDREKLTEKLYTDEEKEYLVDRDSMYIVYPNKESYEQKKSVKNRIRTV